MDRLDQTLNAYFGYDSFKGSQKEIITSILAGEDVIAFLPTGMGKSLTYQLSGLLLPGLVLIISPLLSLMEDQVDQMKKMGLKNSASLNSLKSSVQKREILRQVNSYKYLFLSPEMLMQQDVRSILRESVISLIVVDEAHCISQWGSDFRPDYLRLEEWIGEYSNVQKLALTATATRQVRQDIEKVLRLEKPSVFQSSVNRHNIYYQTEFLPNETSKLERIEELMHQTSTSGIVYTLSRKKADDYAEILRQKGYSIVAYHAGLEKEDRLIIQQQFINGELDWIVATSAFGMGVHKADVRFVIHDYLPGSIHEYMQESGRAGRDGVQSASVILLHERDHEKTIFTKTNGMVNESDLSLFTHYEGSLSELVENGLVEETKLRIWSYWKERLQYEELESHFNRLKAGKMKDIFAVQSLFYEDRCIRKQLVEYYGEDLTDQQTPCCSVCDAEFSSLILSFTREKPLIENSDWLNRLRNLL
ncbi:RecQ family ATP-dependent DNA helicase [Paenisporosarcina cavernae]|nr:RecQ family ATP-dependent DNA helicase [Paenisporosarcina cavernae]